MTKKYPYNLLAKAYGEDKVTAPLNADQLAAYRLFISTLSEQTKQILYLKYEKNLTTVDVSRTLGIMPTNVRSTNERILAKLRQPKNATKILYGLQGSITINDDCLEHLDLSVRTYNTLLRGGISKVSDIKSIHQLQRIRNIGECAIQEVLEKLNRRGIILPQELTRSKKQMKLLNKTYDDEFDVHGRVAAHQELEQFLTSSEDLYGLLQLKKDTPPGEDLISGTESLKRMGITACNYENVIPDNYGLLFVDSLSNLQRPLVGETLEAIKGDLKDTRHAISRSDIVVLHQNGTNSAHFADSFGFTSIPKFAKELEETVLMKDVIHKRRGR